MFAINNQQVTVDRKELLATIKANRTKHYEEYENLLAEWKKALIAELKGLAAQAESGNFKGIRIESVKPNHSLESYDDAIEMLSMSVDDKIILDRGSFKCYVKDEWAWKAGMVATSLANTTTLTKYLK